MTGVPREHPVARMLPDVTMTATAVARQEFG